MCATGARRASAPIPWWFRIFLAVNVAQDLGIAVSGLVFPADIVIPLKGLSPLNARFIASLYLGGGVVILLAAFVRQAIDARIALLSFLTITVLVLAMTLVYWREFTVDGVPWLWMVTYVVDPLVASVAVVRLGLIGAGDPGRHRLTTLLLGQTVVFAAVGVSLLIASEGVLGAWPWAVSPLLARVYAAFFLAFAVGALLAAFERRPAAIRPLVAGSVVLLVSTATTSLIHLARFDPGLSRWLWFALHAVGIVLLATALRMARP